MDVRRFALSCALAVLSAVHVPGMANAVPVLDFDTPAEADARSIFGVDDYLSYTFRIELGPGESVVGFDAVFTSATMHQVNPGGAETVWTDNNGLFIPALTTFTPADDSQFHFDSDFWDFEFVPGDFPPEEPENTTPGVLAVAVSDPDAPLSTNFVLAHVVIPAMASGQYRIGIGYTVGADPDVLDLTFPPSGDFAQFGVVPEASQVIAGTMLTMGMLGVYFVRRRLSKRAVAA